MSDWTAGYMADIGYTFGYYTELNPLRVKLAFLNAGLAFPDVGTACELGFGQGLSVNLHAAASVTQWYGTDFNPAQAGFAQELATAAGVGAQLHDDAFADFCSRADLPCFDYIGLHGIWSWISEENRAIIVDFVRRKLKVGGVLYISYNTLPGWSNFAPMRHLLTQHASAMGVEGAGIVNRIENALGFAQQLVATNPTYVKINPTVPERLKAVQGQDRQYLAHEYFNADWHPMYFADMTKWLSSAKVSFACSANLLDHIDAINLTAEQQTLLKSISDPDFRQTTRDYMVNQQFRKDYWVKGTRRLNALAQAEALRDIKVILTTYKNDVSLKITGALGEATLSEPVYGPVLDSLADHQPRTLGWLEGVVKERGVNFAQLTQALLILAGAGAVSAVQDDVVITKAKTHTDKLNENLINKARGSSDICYLASPVTGGGFAVNRFQQLFLTSIGQGKRQPAEWAQCVWQTIATQGQKLVKEGKPLESTEENLAELTVQAQAFAEKQLPILKALQIA